jgi:hypothetical protein
MPRQPSHYHGRLWHALLAVLVMGGLGIWHGGRCPDDASVRHVSTTVTGPAATAAVVQAQAPAILEPLGSVAMARAAVAEKGHVGAALEVPHTVAGDCHVVTSTEPATRTGATSVTPPIQAHTGAVVGAAVRRPAPRLLTGRSLTEIGVSRT